MQKCRGRHHFLNRFFGGGRMWNYFDVVTFFEGKVYMNLEDLSGVSGVPDFRL